MAKGRGRPSKYDEKYCEEIIAHCSKGGFVERFAINIGVHTDTLLEWCKKHEEFSVAYKRARLAHLAYMLELGHDLVTGKERGQAGPWYFLMKNIHGWRDVVDQQHNLNITGIVFDSEYEPGDE